MIADGGKDPRSRGCQVAGVGGGAPERGATVSLNAKWTGYGGQAIRADATRRARLYISFFVARNRDFDGKNILQQLL